MSPQRMAMGVHSTIIPYPLKLELLNDSRASRRAALLWKHTTHHPIEALWRQHRRLVPHPPSPKGRTGRRCHCHRFSHRSAAEPPAFMADLVDGIGDRR